MNISEQQLDPNFLRRHPRSYTEEPIAEDKMGGRNQMREKIAELIRELEKERKRSARWKKLCGFWRELCLTALPRKMPRLYFIYRPFKSYDRQTD